VERVSAAVRESRAGGRVLSTLVLVVLGLTACGDSTAGSSAAPVESVAPIEDVASLKAAIQCAPAPEGIHEDWVPMPLVMADVGWWMHVDSLVSGSAKSAEAGEPIVVQGSTKPGGDAEVVKVDLYSGAIPMLEAALKANGVEVYFGVGSSTGQIGQDTVWVPLALDKIGFTFLGGCEAVRSNQEMELLLGSRSRDVVESAIWLTGDEMKNVLGMAEPDPVPTSAAQVVPGVTPEYADQADLLGTYALNVEWPSSVRSDHFTLCVRAYDVWGSCVLLGALPPDYGPYRMEFTVPKGAAPIAELWLLDAAANPEGEKSFVVAVDTEHFAIGAAADVRIGELRLPSSSGSPNDVGVADVAISAAELQAEASQ
jgi:hypothetical protein